MARPFLYALPTVEPPRLWIVRHGETSWARLGRHTSRTDVALTPAGRDDGRRVGAALAGARFALVLSSPRRRALDTARLAGYGDRVEVTDDLAEWDYGADEGRTTIEMICAVFESQRTGGPVQWPLKTRVNPLSLL